MHSDAHKKERREQKSRSIAATIVYAIFSLLFAGLALLCILALVNRQSFAWNYLLFAVAAVGAAVVFLFYALEGKSRKLFENIVDIFLRF